MKTLFEKTKEHMISILFGGFLIAVSFYYSANNDIGNLKEKAMLLDMRTISNEKRINEKDVQFESIMTSQRYIIQTLEEIKTDLKEVKK